MNRILVIFSFCTFIPSLSLAQAAGAATGSVVAAGGATVATTTTGGGLMKKTCGTPQGATMCAIGASLVVAAVMDIMQSNGYQNSAGAIDNSGTTGTGSTDTSVPTSGISSLPPEAQAAYNQAAQTAADNGTSLGALAAQGDAAIKSGQVDMNDPALQAALSAAKGMKIKYSVSGVPLEDGSGGRRAGVANSDGMDLNAILDGLKNGRNPASVVGLQKTLNGEPIGVAGDNIFQQVTRKYKTKIASQSFLAVPTTLHHK